MKVVDHTYQGYTLEFTEVGSIVIKENNQSFPNLSTAIRWIHASPIDGGVEKSYLRHNLDES